MKEWQIRQDIFHRLKREHSDDLNNVAIEESEEITNNAVRYFTEKNVGWIYPAKSYAVAICYARWLSEYFGESPYDYLDNETLLYNNDPFFVPYKENPIVYDEILCKIGGWQFVKNGMTEEIYGYFLEEFLIEKH